MKNLYEFKLYSISDEYISYPRKEFKNVYSNKESTRIHTRKYIGVALKINNYLYYIPMSSPKDTDYKFVNGKKIIRKSIIPIMRIISKNSNNEYELKATLRISHMLPVPESELQLYDVENETDLQYKDLVRSEIIYIRKNQLKIRSNAELIYKQKIENDQTAGYINSALDYKKLEKLCSEYIKSY